MERKSGVLMPLFSLPGEYGCGTFGKEAKNFVSCLSQGGFAYWQMLPLLIPDEYNSPYSSYSSFAGNPFFINPERLFEKGLITEEELLKEQILSPYICNYKKIKNTRLSLLKKAALRVLDKESILKFSKENPHIKAFCRFMCKRDETDFFVWQFIQYEFFKQLSELKEYANAMGIKLIGDIPFYSSPESADVWESPRFFILDKNKKPLLLAGVPPDYFSPEGQLWGNPVYNWDELEKEGYSWHVQKITFWLKFFDGLRLDHFRAFESFWAVKQDEKTARNGEWITAPGLKIINKIKEASKDKLMIAEDLGDITPAVTRLVQKSGFMSTRVFQFGFDTENLHTPHNYTENCVAYTGTHDNNTMLGCIWESEREKRKRLFEYCGYSGDNFDKGLKNVIKSIMASHASLTIFPLQDLAGYGADTRINVPSTKEKNWQWRISKEQLQNIDFEYFCKENKLYGRN